MIGFRRQQRWRSCPWWCLCTAWFKDFYEIISFSALHCTEHTSYLDIYISQKIMCSWFGRQISNQPTGQTYQLFGLEIQIYYTQPFFAEFVKSTAFYTLLLLFQRVDISKLHFDAKITIQMDLTNSAKNRRKMSIIDLNFQTKTLISLACRLVWNLTSKSTTHSHRLKTNRCKNRTLL